MLKKLTALSLSLLFCLTLLATQAGAMDATEDTTPVQAENQISPENADTGIAPCCVEPPPGFSGGVVGAGDYYGGGGDWGGDSIG